MAEGIVHTSTTVLTLGQAGNSCSSVSEAPPTSSTTASSTLHSKAINVGRRLSSDRGGLRCASCRLPVTEAEADSGKVIYSLRRLWHRAHFSCVRCNAQIGMDGREFRPCPGARDRPMCLDCFMEKTHPQCFGCGKPLMETCVRVGKNRWHRSCLRCERCKNPFPGIEYILSDGKMYDHDCYHLKKLEHLMITPGSESNDTASTGSTTEATAACTSPPKPAKPEENLSTASSMESTQPVGTPSPPEKISILDLPNLSK